MQPIFKCVGTAAVALLAATSQAQGVINVEIDYMVDTDHSHEPALEEMLAVQQMFACHGWVLNFEIDDAIPHFDVMECDDHDENFWNCDSATSYDSIREEYYDHEGEPWHYCIFGHRYDSGNGTGSSGLATNFDKFVVTLGGFTGQVGTPFDRAGTFAHELGHNLGLGHASPFSTAGTAQYSPNYASVMSYNYQLRGVKARLECVGLVDEYHKFKNLDYSNGRLPIMFETGLIEGRGMGIVPVDWDCDGSIDVTSVAQDISSGVNWCNQTGPQGTVWDYNDWDNIVDGPTSPMPIPHEHTYECMTAKEAKQIEEWDHQIAHAVNGGKLGSGIGGTSCPDPDVTLEPCYSSQMIFVDSGAIFVGGGNGSFPYKFIDDAIAASPSNSVLYLQPGVHNISPGLITKRLTIAGPGVATVIP